METDHRYQHDQHLFRDTDPAENPLPDPPHTATPMKTRFRQLRYHPARLQQIATILSPNASPKTLASLTTPPKPLNLHEAQRGNEPADQIYRRICDILQINPEARVDFMQGKPHDLFIQRGTANLRVQLHRLRRDYGEPCRPNPSYKTHQSWSFEAATSSTISVYQAFATKKPRQATTKPEQAEPKPKPSNSFLKLKSHLIANRPALIRFQCSGNLGCSIQDTLWNFITALPLSQHSAPLHKELDDYDLLNTILSPHIPNLLHDHSLMKVIRRNKSTWVDGITSTMHRKSTAGFLYKVIQNLDPEHFDKDTPPPEPAIIGNIDDILAAHADAPQPPTEPPIERIARRVHRRQQLQLQRNQPPREILDEDGDPEEDNPDFVNDLQPNQIAPAPPRKKPKSPPKPHTVHTTLDVTIKENQIHFVRQGFVPILDPTDNKTIHLTSNRNPRIADCTYEQQVGGVYQITPPENRWLCVDTQARADVLNYSTQPKQSTNRGLNNRLHRIGLEIEFSTPYTKETAIRSTHDKPRPLTPRRILQDYGWAMCFDRSVEGAELKSPIIYYNTPKDITPQIPEKIADFVNKATKSDQCGGHLNYSHAQFNSTQCFNVMCSWGFLMPLLYTKRIHNKYCQYIHITQPTEHYQWMRLKESCIEIRIFPGFWDLHNILWRARLMQTIFETAYTTEHVRQLTTLGNYSTAHVQAAALQNLKDFLDDQTHPLRLQIATVIDDNELNKRLGNPDITKPIRTALAIPSTEVKTINRINIQA